MLPAGLALAALAVLLHLAELDVLTNLAKLFALVCIGFWFLSWFENVMWAALIAVLIPWVDAISVWRGPTEYVVEEQPQIFDTVSIAFRVPGEDGTANLGPPDILFFALFLAAADRFALRVAWTWLAMTGLLGATLIVTATTDVSGLPGAAGDLHRLPAPERRHPLDGAAPARAGAGADLWPHGRALLRPRRRRDRADADEGRPADARPAAGDGDGRARRPERRVHGRAGAGRAGRPLPPHARGPRRRQGARARPPERARDRAQDDVSSYLEIVHPEQLAAEEDKVERLKRERR